MINPTNTNTTSKCRSRCSVYRAVADFKHIHLKKASAQIPVIAITGSVSANVLLDHGIHNLFSITPRAMPLEEALANVKHNLQACSRNIAALYAMNLKQCTKEK